MRSCRVALDRRETNRASGLYPGGQPSHLRDPLAIEDRTPTLSWWVDGEEEVDLLDVGDWTAAWIAGEDEEARDDRSMPPQWSYAPAPATGARLFRLPFECDAGTVAVTLP